MTQSPFKPKTLCMVEQKVQSHLCQTAKQRSWLHHLGLEEIKQNLTSLLSKIQSENGG